MMGGEACLQFVQSTCTVLARIVLYFLCNAGEIGSISIREKDGALAGRPKGSLSNRERCDAAAGDFRSLPRFGGAVAMLRTALTMWKRTHSSALSSRWRTLPFPNADNGDGAGTGS